MAEKKRTTYFVMAKCDNCEVTEQVKDIPIGTSLSKVPCRFCGCKKLAAEKSKF